MKVREFFELFRRVPEPPAISPNRADIVKALVHLSRRAKQEGFDTEIVWCLGVLCEAVNISVQEVSLALKIEETAQAKSEESEELSS